MDRDGYFLSGNEEELFDSDDGEEEEDVHSMEEDEDCSYGFEGEGSSIRSHDSHALSSRSGGGDDGGGAAAGAGGGRGGGRDVGVNKAGSLASVVGAVLRGRGEQATTLRKRAGSSPAAAVAQDANASIASVASVESSGGGGGSAVDAEEDGNSWSGSPQHKSNIGSKSGKSGKSGKNHKGRKPQLGRALMHKVLRRRRLVNMAMLSDLQTLREREKAEVLALNLDKATPKEIGHRLLFLFQSDLLQGLRGAILESKARRDFDKPGHVPRWQKIVGWVFLVTLDAAMLLYIMLFAFSQKRSRQSAWFLSFMLWLCLEMFLISSAAVIFTHIVLPHLIMRDVTEIKERLVQDIHDFHSNMRYNFSLTPARNSNDADADAGADSAGAGLLQGRRSMANDTEAGESQKFNAASYLYISQRVARHYPDILESQIVLQYSTPWPRQSYQYERNRASSYNRGFSSFVRPFSTFFFYFMAYYVIYIPESLQDMIVEELGNVVIGYLTFVHYQLWGISPFMVAVPLVFVVIFTHFWLVSSRADAAKRMARLKGLGSTRPEIHNAYNTQGRDAGASDLSVSLRGGEGGADSLRQGTGLWSPSTDDAHAGIDADGDNDGNGILIVKRKVKTAAIASSAIHRSPGSCKVVPISSAPYGSLQGPGESKHETADAALEVWRNHGVGEGGELREGVYPAGQQQHRHAGHDSDSELDSIDLEHGSHDSAKKMDREKGATYSSAVGSAFNNAETSGDAGWAAARSVVMLGSHSSKPGGSNRSQRGIALSRGQNSLSSASSTKSVAWDSSPSPAAAVVGAPDETGDETSPTAAHPAVIVAIGEADEDSVDSHSKEVTSVSDLAPVDKIDDMADDLDLVDRGDDDHYSNPSSGELSSDVGYGLYNDDLGDDDDDDEESVYRVNRPLKRSHTVKFTLCDKPEEEVQQVVNYSNPLLARMSTKSEGLLIDDDLAMEDANIATALTYESHVNQVGQVDIFKREEYEEQKQKKAAGADSSSGSDHSIGFTEAPHSRRYRATAVAGTPAGGMRNSLLSSSPAATSFAATAAATPTAGSSGKYSVSQKSAVGEAALAAASTPSSQRSQKPAGSAGASGSSRRDFLQNWERGLSGRFSGDAKGGRGDAEDGSSIDDSD